MTSKAKARSKGSDETVTDKGERDRRKFAPLSLLRRGKRQSSDVVVAGLGIALGLVCALFPWYIFMHQDQFGIQAMRFDSQREGGSNLHALDRPERGQSVSANELPAMGIDFLATASPNQRPHREAELAAAKNQPFPAGPPNFSLVHVANGRAMIRDEDGIWVVQKGSRLPDGSHASAIKRQDGQWILVTSRDHVVKLAN